MTTVIHCKRCNHSAAQQRSTVM